MMHPLRSAVEAALAGSLDFLIVVGGDQTTRLKMGLPRSVVDRQPLLLAFPAQYHAYSMPTGDEDGLICQLSFDTLYTCRIPWSTIRQFVINYPGNDAWPEAWSTDAEREAQPAAEIEAPAEPSAPHPDNVRLFRPRGK